MPKGETAPNAQLVCGVRTRRGTQLSAPSGSAPKKPKPSPQQSDSDSSRTLLLTSPENSASSDGSQQPRPHAAKALFGSADPKAVDGPPATARETPGAHTCPLPASPPLPVKSPGDGPPRAAPAHKFDKDETDLSEFNAFGPNTTVEVHVALEASTPCKGSAKQPVHQVWIDCARTGAAEQYKVTRGTRETDTGPSTTKAVIEVSVTSTPPVKSPESSWNANSWAAFIRDLDGTREDLYEILNSVVDHPYGDGYQLASFVFEAAESRRQQRRPWTVDELVQDVKTRCMENNCQWELHGLKRDLLSMFDQIDQRRTKVLQACGPSA